MDPQSQRECFYEAHKTAKAAFLSPPYNHSGHYVKMMGIYSPSNQEIGKRKIIILNEEASFLLALKYDFPFFRSTCFTPANDFRFRQMPL